MDILKKLKNHITLDIFIYRLMHNVFCVVAPPPYSFKKIIIHEIIHEIFSIYIIYSTNKIGKIYSRYPQKAPKDTLY